MAKKTPEEQQKSLLISTIKKVINKNSVTAVLETVYLTGSEAIMTDLETAVSIPYKIPGIKDPGICIYHKDLIDCLNMMKEPQAKAELLTKPVLSALAEFTEGKRRVKVTGEHPDNFPYTTPNSAELFHVGDFTEQHLEDLEIALCYVSNDALRPSMTGIQVGDHITATDAHRLYFKPIEPLMESMILPAKAVKILLNFGPKHWQVFCSADALHTAFLSDDGTYIITRNIDARYPDWKVVIPDKKECAAIVTGKKEDLLEEIKNAGKYANSSTNCVTLGLNGKVTISAREIDFKKEYSNEVNAKVKFTGKGLKYYKITSEQEDYEGKPVWIVKKFSESSVVVRGENKNYRTRDWTVPVSDLEKLPDAFDIGFNANFLTEIISKFEKGYDVNIELWSPTKPAIINENFLVMPLMLNS